MSRKLIFLDIDGTLVAFRSELSPLAAAAVRGAQAMGNGVFLCTGRNMPSIQKELLDLGFDGVIASAGSYIEVGGEVLLDDPMPEELVQECLSVFHRNGIFCWIETREGTYIDDEMTGLLERSGFEGANSEMRRMLADMRSNLRLRPYAAYPRQGAYKICFTSLDLPSVEEARKVLGDRFDVIVHPFSLQPSCYNGEIIRWDAGKGLALERVCRHLGVDTADSIAFGDSMNDYAMLRRAGTGVAMGNACPELKDACDAVCEDADQDGVYHELVRRGLCAAVSRE